MNYYKLISLALMLSVTSSLYAEVVIGVFPRRPALKTEVMFTPLAKVLEEKLGEKTKLVVPKSFKAFWQQLEQGKFDVVHYNPYHYILSHKKYGYRVFAANEEFGQRQLRGALVVRKESPIQKIEDLKGKTILFGGGKKALASYIAPTYLLKHAGLQEGKDYKAKFARNPPNAVIGVYSGLVSASGSGSIVLNVKMVADSIDVSKVRILAETDNFVHLSWAVKNSVSDEKLQIIRDTMLNLKKSEKGRQVLKSARVTNFYAVGDKDFVSARKITDYVFNK